ncbi:MAG: hypothetical protein IJ123_02550 [Blautia sp.]|nr:hypothetical protein [Blautia sp.]
MIYEHNSEHSQKGTTFMKAARHVLYTFLSIILLLTAGCGGNINTAVRKAVAAELDPLKSLDPDEAYSYLSQTELFHDDSWSPDMSSTEEVKDVFSLFFKNFDYEILSADISDDGKTASASVRLKTIDAKSLSKDFASSSLRESIEDEAAGESSKMTTEERYLLLNHLLKTGEYEFTESDCTLRLSKTDAGWRVNHTSVLENQLVGGLITWLSDSYILTPEETLNIYLNTIRKMNIDDLCNYLGIAELINNSDDTLSSIYNAMAEQAHEHFNYEVLGSTINKSSAEVEARITSFDSDAIMDNYHSQMDAYLGTADAVIDGAETRLTHSRELLLRCLDENTAVNDSNITFNLKNDGVSWKLTDPGKAFGDALFGSIEIDETYDQTN